MIAILDLDVRVLAPAVPGSGPEGVGAVLARVGRSARFAALCGLDAIGAVGRFSAMHGPGVLQALQGTPHADEEATGSRDGARVFTGGEVRTAEGARAVVFGPPRALMTLAAAFPVSLYAGFRPRLDDLALEAARRDLLVLVRTDGDPRDAVFALGRPALRGVQGLLAGPQDAVPRVLARSLGRPVAGGSGAERRAEIGARRTAVDMDALRFEDLRHAFLEGAVTAIGARGPIGRAFAEGAAAVHAMLESVRGG